MESLRQSRRHGGSMGQDSHDRRHVERRSLASLLSSCKSGANKFRTTVRTRFLTADFLRGRTCEEPGRPQTGGLGVRRCPVWSWNSRRPHNTRARFALSATRTHFFLRPAFRTVLLCLACPGQLRSTTFRRSLGSSILGRSTASSWSALAGRMPSTERVVFTPNQSTR